jgi:hypothetical protein
LFSNYTNDGETNVFKEINVIIAYYSIYSRQQIIVDYIFSEVIKLVIKHYDGVNVKEKTVDQLEDAIIRFFLVSPYWFVLNINNRSGNNNNNH